jgi:hypothetical protein
MSGQFCGGCGEGELVDDPAGKGRRPVVCDLCGWTADGADVPRKWPMEDEAPWTKRERKAAGTLFFLWVDVDRAAEDVEFGIMDVLELTSLTGGGPRLLIELEAKPSAATLARLAALKGVTGVRLVP